jgi:hypothetical protein
MKQPAVAVANCDGTMAAGVAWEGDKHDFGVAHLVWRGGL